MLCCIVVVCRTQEPTNPIFNIGEAALRDAIAYFSELESLAPDTTDDSASASESLSVPRALSASASASAAVRETHNHIDNESESESERRVDDPSPLYSTN